MEQLYSIEFHNYQAFFQKILSILLIALRIFVMCMMMNLCQCGIKANAIKCRQTCGETIAFQINILAQTSEVSKTSEVFRA
jgi:large-conductance mechanosensitive channel